MLGISNVKVYDLKESVIASGYAMLTELPEHTDDLFQKGMKRAVKLSNSPSGSGHQTFLSGIRVSFDIKYPNYISPEMQRYHFLDIVTSSSKMHRLLKMDLDKACNEYVSQSQIETLEKDILIYNIISNKEWKDGENEIFVLRNGDRTAHSKEEALYFAFMKCISDCPMGLELFMRCSTNYLQLKTIYIQRKHHKLKEDWGAFCKFIEGLPFANELILSQSLKEDKEND